MKIIYKLLFLLFLMLGYSSCDFLNIVPDEITTEEDAFKDRNAAKNFVYSCYGYLPQSNVASASLDLLTGDEVITAFEHETFASFPKGNYTASSPVISYWNTFFQGLRQCYLFLENVDKVPDLTESVKADYIAQVKFLIAYYHYQLARCYGPIILIKELPNVNASQAEYLPRTPYDECVEWICNLLDEAAASLPAIRTNKEDYGLATSVGAKAVKAKMLLYAASPLFNGNSAFYSNFADKSGNMLMPVTYDPNKWVKARTAIKEAIDLAEQNGHALYTKQDYKIGNEDANPYPAAGPVRCLRTSLVDWDSRNPEVLLAETRSEGSYGIQNKSLPFVTDGWAWNGIGPTWTMLNRFYTKNGLPWDEDPEYKDKDKLKIVNVDADHADEAHEGSKTLLFNLEREPRFYAAFTFQNRRWDLDDKLVYYTDFSLNGNSGQAKNGHDYPRSGVLVRKKRTNVSGVNYYVYIRLSEIYLNYAEACCELDDIGTAINYVNKIRLRAGIPEYKGLLAEDLTPTDKRGFERITLDSYDKEFVKKVIYRERLLELSYENHHYFDVRRWGVADMATGDGWIYPSWHNGGEGGDMVGFDVTVDMASDDAKDPLLFYKRKVWETRVYSKRMSLFPIPQTEINRNARIVQNTGWETEM